MKWSLLLCGLLASCAASFEKVAPRPRVAVVGLEERSLAITLGQRVQEVQTGLSDDGCPNVEAEQWRASLTDGFTAAFSDVVTVAEAPGDLTLVILDAVPSLAATEIGILGTLVGCSVTVRYTAALRTPNGSVIHTGVAMARRRDAVTDGDLASAVEVMYEEIAARFFPLPRRRPLAEGR